MFTCVNYFYGFNCFVNSSPVFIRVLIGLFCEQFTCVYSCPDWAPFAIVEETDKNQTSTICVNEEMYQASIGRQRLVVLCVFLKIVFTLR